VGPDDARTSPRSGRTQQLLELARSVKGFMPEDEGEALFEAALGAGATRRDATLVEVGAWCGKSSVYLGAACEATGALLFSVDHHHGSEENQRGWQHHDLEVVDPATGRIDTLPFWRRTISEAGLDENVVAMVGDSTSIAAHFGTPVDLCFIDGGHGADPAWADLAGWAPKVVLGGVLAIHDVFPNPEDGGRPPYEIWCAAVSSGQFAEVGATGSLRLLRRVGAPGPIREARRSRPSP
jgi:MMP 1-O-methyltransferase